MLRNLILLPALLVLGSCLSATGVGADDTPADSMATAEADADEATKEGAEAGAKKKGKEVDLEALEVALLMAERGLRANEMETEVATVETADKLEQAQRTASEARAELVHFEEYSVPRRMEEAQIGLERSAGRLKDSIAELEQLEAMYAAEEFAESSKELVLERSRRSVALSERSLELARQALVDLEAYELAKQRDKLAQAVVAAELKLQLAQQRAEIAKFKSDTSRRKDQESVRKAQKALEKGRTEAEEAN